MVAAWGLQEVGRHHESVLDLRRIDREVFAAKAASPGVEMRHLPPLAGIGDAQWAELRASVQERFLDAPDSADGGGELRLEMFRVQITQALHMADLGVPSIYTRNMVGNEPILATNRSMGFVRDPGYVDVLVPL